MEVVSAVQSEMRVPIEALRVTPEWGQLTPKQAMFMETYLAGDYDVMTAIRSAFDCSSEQNARVMSYEVLANPKIRAVLDIHFGRSSQESFLARLQKRIEDGSLTVAQIEGAKLLCALRGWTAPEDLPRVNGYVPVSNREPETFFLGQVVALNGKKIRVTKLNADGRPIAGDPVKE